MRWGGLGWDGERARFRVGDLLGSNWGCAGTNGGDTGVGLGYTVVRLGGVLG